ncbi:hypothetical protein ALC60_14183, partial [Trachymyrmex zeteki]
IIIDNESTDDPEHILWVTGDVLSCSPSLPATQPSPLYSYHVNAPYRASVGSYFPPLCQARRKAVKGERGRERKSQERERERERDEFERKKDRKCHLLLYIYSNRIISAVLASGHGASFVVIILGHIPVAIPFDYLRRRRFALSSLFAMLAFCRTFARCN